jgi:putative ABC transport system substrate-binding protein
MLVALLATPGAAEAPQTGRVWRIGFLGVANAVAFERSIEAIRLGLRDHGYVEGRNVTIEFPWAEGRYDRLPALAGELVRLNLDVIITHGVPGTLALTQATSTIPIVMAAIGNPVEGGAVASLARPGGNITGSAFLSAEAATISIPDDRGSDGRNRGIDRVAFAASSVSDALAHPRARDGQSPYSDT